MAFMFPIKTRETTCTVNGRHCLFLKKSIRTQENIQKTLNYFSKRILFNEQLLEAPPGLYTWILRESGNLFAARTISKQEIGTLHINLKDLTDKIDDSDIYAAGEFEIDLPVIKFNLSSGTFMAKKFRNAGKIELRNEVVETVEKKLKSLSLADAKANARAVKPVFLECSDATCSEEELISGRKLIEAANIRITPNNFETISTMFNVKNIRNSLNNTRESAKKPKVNNVSMRRKPKPKASMRKSLKKPRK
jgi:hypothetical protein